MKKERTVYWKVLTQDRFSAIASRYGLGVLYPVGETVKKPKNGGPLMVFSGKPSADSFVRNNRSQGDLIVVKCHATKDRKQNRRVLWLGETGYFSIISTVQVFWENGYDHDERYHSNIKEVPDGTVFATSVTCLE